MPILLLLFPLVEIFLIIRLVVQFSFIEVFFFMLSTGVLGLYIMSMIGRALLFEAQQNLSQGRVPSINILHRILIFFGGFLIFLPGVLTDLLGLILILPGLRHFIVFWFRFILIKSIAKQGSTFFKMSAGSFGSFFYTDNGPGFSRPSERDAKVIDIEAIESTHKKTE